MPEFIILQHNCHKSKVVMDELKQYSGNFQDVVWALQEPWRGKSYGLGINSKISAGGIQAKAIVAAPTGKTDMVSQVDLNQQCIAATWVKRGSLECVVVSFYRQQQIDLEDSFEPLTRCLAALRGRTIILCMDANAKAPDWGAPTYDPAGRRLLEILAEHQLTLLNDEIGLPTYYSSRSHTHIDVSAATRDISNRIVWRNVGLQTSSDHVVMQLTVRTSIALDRVLYNTRGVSWDGWSTNCKAGTLNFWAQLNPKSFWMLKSLVSLRQCYWLRILPCRSETLIGNGRCLGGRRASVTARGE